MIRTWLAGTLVAATTVIGLVPGSPGLAADPTGDPCDLISQAQTGLLSPEALTIHLSVASPYGAVRTAARPPTGSSFRPGGARRPSAPSRTRR